MMTELMLAGVRVLFGAMLPLSFVGCPLLALAGMGCLFLCKGGRFYRQLVWAAGIFCVALVLFFGGNILLGFFRLAWRNLPSALLCWTLLLSGWAGIVLTLLCLIPQKLSDLAPFLRVGVKAAVSFFAGLVLFVSLVFAPLLLTFTFGSGETVVEDQGQKLVERMEGFLSPDYSYYVYCGPLVRGTERIYMKPFHIDGDMG